MSVRAGRRSAYAIISGVAILAVYFGVQSYEYHETKPIISIVPQMEATPPVPAHLTRKEAALTTFFEKQNSPVPVEMARAVVKRKRPRLLAAVAAVESNGTPWAKGNAGEVTAWQIIEREWGYAGKTTEEHAQKAEEILEHLLKESNGNIRKALELYNGGAKPGPKSRRYAQRVLNQIGKVNI